MSKRKHAEVAIHWFNGGQIEWNNKQNASDDESGWNLWTDERTPTFWERTSFRTHDPYRELKKRFEEGAVIQFESAFGVWTDCNNEPGWLLNLNYREKPAEPPAKREEIKDTAPIKLNVVCNLQIEIEDNRVVAISMDAYREVKEE